MHLRGLPMCDFRKRTFKRAANACKKQCLWLGLTCITLDKSPLKGLLYHCRKVIFERAVDVYEKHINCLWEGYRYMWEAMPFGRAYMHNSRKSPLRRLPYHHREISYERVVHICEKECLWVGLSCMILEMAFKKAANVCTQYRIFIKDGGFESALVTLLHFAPQFHRFLSGFWQWWPR